MKPLSIGHAAHSLAVASDTIAQARKSRAQRRALAQLDDRQLRDAGIDPALAGRGKAVAVDRAALLRLETLSSAEPAPVSSDPAMKDNFYDNLPPPNASRLDIELWARDLRRQWFRQAWRSALTRLLRGIEGARTAWRSSRAGEP